MNRRFPRKHRVATLALAVAIAAGGGVALALPDSGTNGTAPGSTTATLLPGPVSFAQLVEQVKPAVVNIAVTGKVSDVASRGPQKGMPEMPEGAPFNDLFRDFFERFQEMPRDHGDGHGFRAGGSGFIVSDDGYVVTNHHVIDKAEKIEVVLDDGSRYPATVRGSDPKTDLALLKIEADAPLPYVAFGDSDRVKVGEWVVAVGNPFGLGGTVTAGIVSARGRDIQSGPYDDYLQIDAPINRGNSGGPLFDASGKVIGINTAIFSPTGGSVGIGFAIPATLADDVVAELRADGRVERGWLGVQIQPVSDEVAESFDLDEAYGALVASVVPDSPADAAGLQPGDIILGVNGERLEAFRDLPKRVAALERGSEAMFDLWRDGKPHTLDVTIRAMPDDEPKLAETKVDGEADDTPKLGVYLTALTPELKAKHALPESSRGVLVVQVEDDSPAARAGIRGGSVIEMVNRTVVTSPDEVVEKVSEAATEERKAVMLLIAYEGEKRFVPVRLANA